MSARQLALRAAPHLAPRIWRPAFGTPRSFRGARHRPPTVFVFQIVRPPFPFSSAEELRDYVRLDNTRETSIEYRSYNGLDPSSIEKPTLFTLKRAIPIVYVVCDYEKKKETVLKLCPPTVHRLSLWFFYAPAGVV